MHKDSIQLLSKLVKSAPVEALRHLHADLQAISSENFQKFIDELKAARSPGYRTARDVGKSSSSPAARVRRLMIDELGLDRDVAILRLCAVLKSRGYSPVLPVSSRQTFESWVFRLMKIIPAGEILAAAIFISGSHATEAVDS